VAEYPLPELDYDYGALEPHICDRSTKSTTASTTRPMSRCQRCTGEALGGATSGDHASILLNEKNLAFNLGGHVNHTIWWKNLSQRR